jgi:hypothetical protein
MYRLDTRTGQTSLVTDKGLKSLADDRSIELRVGQIYKLENGKSALYEGKEKLNSDTRRIADAVVEKYSDKSNASEDRKPRAEVPVRDNKGQSTPPPPPGFVINPK